MSKEKKQLFLSKIKSVADGEMLSTEAEELTIDSRKTFFQCYFRNDVEIDVSLLVAFISTDSRASTTMKVSYTSCMATISYATPEYLDKVKEHLKKLIKSALQHLVVPAHRNLADLERDLLEDGEISLSNLLSQR